MPMIFMLKSQSIHNQSDLATGSTWFKSTKDWHGSGEAGTSVKVLFVEDHFVFYHDKSNEVRCLSEFAFRSTYVSDIDRIDPFLPYGYAMLHLSKKYSVVKPTRWNTPKTVFNRWFHRYYKMKKFFRCT
jgi:hypothetical protein